MTEQTQDTRVTLAKADGYTEQWVRHGHQWDLVEASDGLTDFAPVSARDFDAYAACFASRVTA